MIVSKPKFKALFALGLFLLLVYIAFFMLLHYMLSNQYFPILMILLTGAVCALAFGLTIKSLNDFKSLRLSNNQLQLSSYFGLYKKIYRMEELKAWTEEIVQTKASPYEEITLVFSNNKFVKINNQQDSAYRDFHKYLKKKKSKIRVERKK